MTQTLRDVLINGTGTERPFLCPVHGDSRPSASVNVLKGLWICYTCGAKGNLEGYDGDVDHLEIVEGLLEQAAKAAKSRPIYTEAWLNQYDSGPIHPYWLTRFGSDAVRWFRLGYDAERNAATYPLRTPSDRVLGVVRRPLDPDHDGPKYKYPFGVDVSELLFNYSFGGQNTVVLVEGALDAVAMWEAGITAFAIYGARMSTAQMRLLDKIGCTRIICLFDQDQAGEQATDTVRDLDPGKHVARVNWDTALGKDVAELEPDQRVRVYLDGLAQFDQTRQDQVGSPVCDSSSTSTAPRTLRLRAGRPLSGTTSKPGLLRIVPPRP